MMAVSKPLVSCVMPTANRRAFVPHAIRYFLRQDYPNKELVVVDDGSDTVGDLIPDHLQVRYVRLEENRTLGAKRNRCVELSRGDYIMHWDDDDWMASHRISYQVEQMLAVNANVCGVQQMYFYDIGSGEGWLYRYTDKKRMWLAGGSLLYTRDFWKQAPFPDIQVASDTRFIFKQKMNRALILPDYDFYVALIHPRNTSKKSLRGAYWSRWNGDMQKLMGDDYPFYQGLTQQATPKISKPLEATVTIPKFAILMIVHNAREVVKISVQQTLQNIAGQDARLVVVDNASNDGIEKWLDFLEKNGDIQLIRTDKNIGHGPALELARKQTQSPYIVTLDSDAFPLQSDWLTQLESRLSDKTKVTGILHHRDYIHPSCLMIERETLDNLNLTFLNEKHLPSRFDVAERISHAICDAGYTIAGLKRVDSQRRGSASEPVYLGSNYENIVYHQWYTTRADMAGGQHSIDDVPDKAIEQSLAELFSHYHAQRREITVIMGVRSLPSEPLRLRNAIACLKALNHQSLERWRYRLVVVEQDKEPRLKETIAPYIDRYIFAYNPNAYNRSWGFNVGVKETCCQETILCLVDSDLFLPQDFLASGLNRFKKGVKALQPYHEVVYLDVSSTQKLINNHLHPPTTWQGYHGRVYTNSQGGCLWVDSTMYQNMGGHDETFEGWGSEDRDFWKRLSQHTTIDQLRQRIAHLYHEKPEMDGAHSIRNRKHHRSKNYQSATSNFAGDIHRYENNKPTTTPKPQRDWQHWHAWQPERIAGIIHKERTAYSSISLRAQLPKQVLIYGDHILDVGCGAGAMWQYLPNSTHIVGVDITDAMLRVARQYTPDVPLAQVDSGCLSFADNSFDVVVIRHVLEHLPDWLMRQTLSEAIRVAEKAIIVSFHIPPTENVSSTKRVGANFLQSCWNDSALVDIIQSDGAHVAARLAHVDEKNDLNEVWIIEKQASMSRPTSTNMQPKISIVMPTYRRGHIIWQTIQHIYAQTYTNWELIIIDNQAQGTYYFADERVQVYQHAERLGSSYARNMGLQYCSGDFVCFFDDDDAMFPEYLETFINTFKGNPHAKLIRCGMIVSNGKVNYSYATPECCLRREYTTTTWEGRGPAQDQRYFKRIIAQNRWTEEKGDIVLVRKALCQAITDSYGGLRNGRY